MRREPLREDTQHLRTLLSEAQTRSFADKIARYWNRSPRLRNVVDSLLGLGTLSLATWYFGGPLGSFLVGVLRQLAGSVGTKTATLADVTQALAKAQGEASRPADDESPEIRRATPAEMEAALKEIEAMSVDELAQLD